MGIYNPQYRKGGAGSDDIGNSSFLKKVIKKQSVAGTFNKRGRREDSVSSSGDEAAEEEVK